MKNTDFESIQAFLQSPITKEDFEMDTVMWIDWRECDDAIVECIANIIPLQYEVKPSALPREMDIVLQYKNRQMEIPYATAYTDRDTTLRAIAKIIHPDYEIRWYLPSLGNDTLGFCVLSAQNWRFLEKTYGRDYTTWYFTPVCENSVMFDMDIDCVFAIVKQRKEERSQYI